MDLLTGLFLPNDASATTISRIPLSVVHREDVRIWYFTKSRNYIVKSAIIHGSPMLPIIP